MGFHQAQRRRIHVMAWRCSTSTYAGTSKAAGAFEHSMDTHGFRDSAEGSPRSLLAELAQLTPGMQQRAPQLDRTADFPTEDIDLLRSLGALAAPLPPELGG